TRPPTPSPPPTPPQPPANTAAPSAVSRYARSQSTWRTPPHAGTPSSTAPSTCPQAAQPTTNTASWPTSPNRPCSPPNPSSPATCSNARTRPAYAPPSSPGTRYTAAVSYAP